MNAFYAARLFSNRYGLSAPLVARYFAQLNNGGQGLMVEESNEYIELSNLNSRCGVKQDDELIPGCDGAEMLVRLIGGDKLIKLVTR